MANAPNTGSTLSYASGTNKTSTAISTNILIMVNSTVVGAVQSLSINEKRDVQMINEVGTDGSIDSTPYKSATFSGSCKRIRFDRLRIAEAFSRGFIHVQSQAYPFDIVVLDKQKADVANQISTVIKNVWMTGIDYSYEADNWIITDTMSWVAETLYSTLSVGSGQPVAQGGERGIKYSNVILNGQSIERLTDTGANGRRGSLDFAGLIDLGNSGNIF
jgi:hypothetical protein